MVNSADFSKRIHKIMEKNDLNASSFAEAINVGRSSISHILSGRNKPSLDLVMNIVSQFPEVDLYWILNGTGTYPKTEQVATAISTTAPIAVIDDQKTEEPVPDKNASTSATDLLSVIDKDISEKQTVINNGKNITKVIILYSDGSFKDYLPE